MTLRKTTLVTGISVRPQITPAWPPLATVAVTLLMRMFRQMGVVPTTAAALVEAAIVGVMPVGSLFQL